MTCREYPPPYEEAMFGSDNMANSRASISVISTMATPTGSRRGSRTSQGCLGGRDHFIILFPRMHIYMAYACAIVNFILPGIGTMIAGFSIICCCTKKDDLTCGKKLCTVCLSSLIGVLQLASAPVLFMGWVWSILWGLTLIGVSDRDYHGHIRPDDRHRSSTTSSIIHVYPSTSGHRMSMTSGSNIMSTSRQSSLTPSMIQGCSFVFHSEGEDPDQVFRGSPQLSIISRLSIDPNPACTSPPPPYEEENRLTTVSA